jgi:uncharacterized protein (DUF1330 family)
VRTCRQAGGYRTRSWFPQFEIEIIAFEGEPPKRVAITEWDSLEQAEAFVDSAAYKSLAPERAKAAKIREYAVEATHY